MRIDISWRDIACGLWRCIGVWRRAPSIAPERVLVCLSVRSGFDLLLQSLKLPSGSEVIMSAVNIPDMFQIVREHGLVPVPLDLDFATSSPSAPELRRLLTPKTRAVVIAHLFGARIELEPILAIARERGLLVIEDYAQALSAAKDLGHPEADFNLLSFGPIKTATALGGALIRVRDPQIFDAMRCRQSEYPCQRRATYFGRLLKYAALKWLSGRWRFALLVFAIKRFGGDPDRVFRSLTRNFGAKTLLDRIRWRPCQTLQMMVIWRWSTFSAARVQRRVEIGANLARRLENVLPVPGARAAAHSHWVFPICCDERASLISLLQQNGFDATGSHNLTVLQESGDPLRSLAPNMTQMLSRIVFLPCYPELDDAAVNRMAQLIESHASRTTATPQTVVRKAS